MNRSITIPVLAVALIAATMLYLQTQETFEDPEQVLSSGAEGDPMVEVRVPATLSENAKIGKAGFDAKCASCHGANAAGQQGVAPPLVHKIYEPSHHGDMAFKLAARTGVRAHHWSFGSMPPVEDISDAEIAQVTLYVRELQRENGIK